MVLLLGGGGGTDLSAATAIPSRVLAGYTFFSSLSDEIQVGTIPNRGAVTITPSASAQTIAEGYHNGSGTVPAVSFTASNVLTGTTIAGTAGTMVNRGAVTITPSSVAQTITQGYHNGNGSVAAVSFTASNVLIGTTIAGTAGTMPNYSSSLLTSSSYSDTGSAIRLNTPNTGYMYTGTTGIQITYANLRNLIGLTNYNFIMRNHTILGLSGNTMTLRVQYGTVTGSNMSYLELAKDTGFMPVHAFVTSNASIRTNQAVISLFIIDNAYYRVYYSNATGVNTYESSNMNYVSTGSNTMFIFASTGTFSSSYSYTYAIWGYDT